MPRPKEHVVTLTAGDRAKLSRVVSRGTHPARMIARARILLELDESGGPASDRRVWARGLPSSQSGHKWVVCTNPYLMGLEGVEWPTTWSSRGTRTASSG